MPPVARRPRPYPPTGAPVKPDPRLPPLSDAMAAGSVALSGQHRNSERVESMRAVSLLPAIVAALLSSAASAQVWEEYVNRENYFQVNFPGEPTEQELQYKTVKGTTLPARVFTATAPANSVTAGTYRVTVVDYRNAQNELGDAIEQARQAILAKGTAKYDGREN